MKISAKRSDLVALLAMMNVAGGTKSTLPILSCCILKAADGKLTASATDLDLSITSSCPVEVKEEGVLVLSVKRLKDTIQKMTQANPIIMTSTTNHWARVRNGSINARIAGEHPDEFPSLPEVKGGNELVMDSGMLLEMIRKVVFSISTDETRASFMGAFFKVQDDGMLSMVSTDGHRLSVSLRASGLSEEEKKLIPQDLLDGIIIPRKGVKALVALGKDAEKIKFRTNNDELFAETTSASITVRLIPARFPNFSQVLPESKGTGILLDKTSLESALKRAGDYAPQTGNTKLTFSKGKVTVHSFAPECGEFSEEIDCNYDGEYDVSAGYNYKYLLDVLKVIGAPNVIFHVKDTDSPTLISDPILLDDQFIVMPMQF